MLSNKEEDCAFDSQMVSKNSPALLRGLIFGIILLSLIFGNPVFALTLESNYSANMSPATAPSSQYSSAYFADVTVTPLTTASNDVNDNNAPVTSGDAFTGNGFSCDVSSLTPQEAKALLDLAGEGFSGDKLSDGDDSNAAGASVAGAEIIGESPDGKTAVKQTPPDQAASAGRYAVFDGRTIDGPFGLGIVLDDTLRVGRCEYGIDDRDQCRINQNGLNFRTDGTGTVNDLWNAFSSLKDLTKRTAMGVTQEEVEAMENNIVDNNQANFSVVTVEQSEKIPNVFQSKSYTAKNTTNCVNESCVVSTYSSFDKFFNVWLTTDLVVSSIGPSFVYKATKIFDNLKARGARTPLKGLTDIFDKAKTWTELLPSQIVSGKGTIKGIAGGIENKTAGSYFQSIYKADGFEKYVTDFTVGKKMFSSGAGGKVGDLMAADSAIMKLSKEDKGKFLDMINYMRVYSDTSSKAIDAAKKQFADGAIDQITLARRLSSLYNDWDNTVYLDFPQWLQQNTDLMQFKGLAVKRAGTPVGEGFIDVENSQAFNFKRIMEKFEDDGGWGGTWTRRSNVGGLNSSDAFEAAGNNLQLYRLEASHVVVNNASVNDITAKIAQTGEGTLFVEIPGRGTLPLNNATKDIILNDPALPGHINILKGDYVPARTLSPQEFAQKLTDDRIMSRPGTATNNMNDLYHGLVQKDFVDRTSFTALDKAFAQQGDMVKAYYKEPMKGLYTGTLMPILYWDAKRGFGNEDFSIYQLPDTWTTLTVSQGGDSLYADSYIDFYANSGSDQGDLFQRAFTSLPFVWTTILNAAVKVSPTADTWLTKLSSGFLGNKAMRDETIDLAFYTHNENCVGCSGGFTYTNDYLRMDVAAPSKLTEFLLEAADETYKSENGTTIISYTHHSDLAGKTNDIEGDGINLVAGRQAGETCDQKLREYGLGWAGTAAGGLLAVGENMAYAVGFGPGLIASGLQQLTVGRALQDCVDDKEGYYIHFWAPPLIQQKSTKTKEVLSNETVSNAIASMTDNVDKLTANSTNPVSEQVKKMTSDFDTFAKQTTTNNLLQARIDLLPPNSGSVQGREVFYIWYKEQVMASAYKDSGQLVISDGNTQLAIDYAGQTISKDGKILVSGKDNINLIAPSDNRIPATVVPKTVTKIGAPQTTSTVFELNIDGEVMILEPQVLACIQKAVKDQTGITYSGNELTQVFGNLVGINTTAYGKIYVRNDSSPEIILEGSGPRMQGGVGSKVDIDGYWETFFKMDSNSNIGIGKFKGMTFANGVIVLKESTNELIVWLRQHQDSILSSKEVSGLKAKLSSVTDPDTGCEQPALTLEATGYPNDERGQQKVDNFNTSMEHLGPFTQFTTDSKIYEFYSKKDENTGECKDFFKVIDKATGKVLTDSEIVGGITQDGDGTLRFTTADGKSHELDFSAENGVPTLSYNGGPVETLRSAQGPNGSFWYDPNTGLWYPENGLQIPLNQAFKDNGTYYGTDENGKVSGQPTNPMTFNIGQGSQGGFNIPSLPQTALQLTLFISLFLLVSFIATRKTSKTTKKKIKKSKPAKKKK